MNAKMWESQRERVFLFVKFLMFTIVNLMNSSSKFFAKYPVDGTIQRSFALSIGNEVKLSSNFFNLSVNDDFLQKLKKYEVTFSPEIKNPHTAKDVLYLSIRGQEEECQRSESKTWKSLIFVWPNKIISADALAPVDVTYNDCEYHLSLSEGKEINDQDTKEYLSKVVRKAISQMGYQKLDHGFYNTTPEKEVQNIQIIQQFNASVNYEDGFFSLFADTKQRVFKSQTLIQLLRDSITKDADTPQERERLEKIALPFAYATNYGHKRIVKITRILWEQPKVIKVFDEETTIPKYFMSEYQIPISESEPCAEVKTFVNDTEHVEYIPISCLVQTGFTPEETQNVKLMQQLIKYTNLTPTESATKINTFVEKLKVVPELADFGVTIGDPVKMTGLVIQPPLMRFRTTQQENNPVEFIDVPISGKCSLGKEVGKYNAALGPILKASPLIVCQKKASTCAKNIKSNLAKTSTAMGIPMLPPDIVFTENQTRDQFISVISHSIQTYGVPSVVIVILPSDNQEFYKGLKTFLTTKLGIHSQFILESTLTVPHLDHRNLYQELMLTIIAKTGGVPFYIAPTSLPLRSTVFVGIEKKGELCSIVASTDSTYARYSSKVATTKDPKEFYLSYLKTLTASRIVIFTTMRVEDAKEIAVFLEGKISNFVMISCARENILLTTEGPRPQPAAPGTTIVRGGVLLIASASSGPAIGRPSSYIIVHHPHNLWKDNQLVTIIHFLCVSYPISIESSELPTPVRYAQKAIKFSEKALDGNQPNSLLENFPYYL